MRPLFDTKYKYDNTELEINTLYKEINYNLDDKENNNIDIINQDIVGENNKNENEDNIDLDNIGISNKL